MGIESTQVTWEKYGNLRNNVDNGDDHWSSFSKFVNHCSGNPPYLLR